MAEVKSQLNNLRLAPRKVRAVSNLIKGKNALDVLSQLEALIRRPSLPVAKLLKSAIANAENNYDMVRENLYVKSINVDEGVKLKRFKPKGFGRVSPIEKKTSRINLVLAEKVPGMKRIAKQAKKTEKTPAVEEKQQVRQTEKKSFGMAQDKPEVKTELDRKENVLKNLGKRIFRRKVV